MLIKTVRVVSFSKVQVVIIHYVNLRFCAVNGTRCPESLPFFFCLY